MGNNSSLITQSNSTLTSILKKYDIVHKNDDESFSIVKEKQSDRLFIVKEITFSKKALFEKHLCRYNHFQEIPQSENILCLQKVWVEQHTNFCSDSYKIFPMYEYSNVTLFDEMEARKQQLKYFEQQELLGIIQSCVNAFTFQPPILLSPNQYFIVSDGLLKINNADLFDTNNLDIYTKGIYYSPEKMQNFNDFSFYSKDQDFIKQTIFSLGITVLSAIYLQDLTDKLYNPLSMNKKMKFNYHALIQLIKNVNLRGLTLISSRLLKLIQKMVDYDPKSRPSLVQIQHQIELISKSKVVTHQTFISQNPSNPENVLKNVDLNTINQQSIKGPIFKDENLSTIYDKNLQNSYIFKNKVGTENSEFQILNQFPVSNRGLNSKQLQTQKSQIFVPFIVSGRNMQSNCLEEEGDRVKYEIGGDLPSPISNENPIFTNPQFLKMMNDQIKKFKFQKKSPFSSTQISRQNSNIFLLRQSQVDKE